MTLAMLASLFIMFVSRYPGKWQQKGKDSGARMLAGSRGSDKKNASRDGRQMKHTRRYYLGVHYARFHVHLNNLDVSLMHDFYTKQNSPKKDGREMQ